MKPVRLIGWTFIIAAVLLIGGGAIIIGAEGLVRFESGRPPV